MKKIFSIFAAVLFAGSLMAADNLGPKTIKEFLDAKNTTDTCVLTGVVYNIYNTTYGNFYLIEGTDTLNVYGLLTAAGESKKFSTLNVAADDTLTIKAVYGEYNNAPQAKNAVFVSVKKSAVIVETPSFASLEALVAADLAAGTMVNVAFEDAEITGFYLNSSSKRRGIYVNVKDKTGAKDIEFYAYTDVPEAWTEGGKVSGDLENVKWDYFSRDSQYEIVVDSWNDLTYKAAPTAIDNTAVEAKAVKTIENGMVIINYNGKRFNVLGQTIR